MLGKNPAAGVKLFNVNNRVEHYLDSDELGRLLRVLKTGSKRNRTARSIALLLLSTGARLNTAVRCRWEDIDRKNRVWRIPAANSKSKKIQSIPLNDSAIAVLDQLNTEGTYDYLFINRNTRQPYTTIHKVWERLRNEAGLPHLRLHDLRHQYASLLVNSGRSLYEVQQILGHSDPKVTPCYAHLSSKSLQDAADSASKIITGAMPKSP